MRLKTSLRRGIAEITQDRLPILSVRFFGGRNPGHARGDELCCLAPLTRTNFTEAAFRVINAVPATIECCMKCGQRSQHSLDAEVYRRGNERFTARLISGSHRKPEILLIFSAANGDTESAATGFVMSRTSATRSVSST